VIETWKIKTSTFTVNDIGDPEPVIVSIDCKQVMIGEDPSVSGWPTTDYQVKGIEASSDWIQCAAGTKFIFQSTVNAPPFSANQVVGYVQTISGSTTFLKAEQ
jgi:hypothetical protein